MGKKKKKKQKKKKTTLLKQIVISLGSTAQTHLIQMRGASDCRADQLTHLKTCRAIDKDSTLFCKTLHSLSNLTSHKPMCDVKKKKKSPHVVSVQEDRAVSIAIVTLTNL